MLKARVYPLESCAQDFECCSDSAVSLAMSIAMAMVSSPLSLSMILVTTALADSLELCNLVMV